MPIILTVVAGYHFTVGLCQPYISCLACLFYSFLRATELVDYYPGHPAHRLKIQDNRYFQWRFAIRELQQMSHFTILGCSYLHNVKQPEQSPQCMCWFVSLWFGGRNIGLYYFDSSPSHIHSPRHAPVCGTYKHGLNTNNAGPGANRSSSFGDFLYSCV